MTRGIIEQIESEVDAKSLMFFVQEPTDLVCGECDQEGTVIEYGHFDQHGILEWHPCCESCHEEVWNRLTSDPRQTLSKRFP